MNDDASPGRLMDPGAASGKLTELDALRGIAAFIVFTGHFHEGLLPAVTRAINGTPLFAALNGPAAVIVFFVLSGFVLTLHPLCMRNPGALPVLAVKRWPRLAGPVAVAGLAYAAAAIIGAYPRPEALAADLRPGAPAYLFWGQAQHSEQVGAVLHEALFGTFLRESAQHNGALWTMHWEFLGSFLSFSLALLVLTRLPIAVRTAGFAAGWVAAALYSPWLMGFPLGVLGAWLHSRYAAKARIAAWPALGMVLCGALLLSWDIRVQAGIWAWTAWLPFPVRLSAWVGAEAVAAGLWMAVALYNPAVRRVLSGRAGALAGRMSFAFYLIHLLVLCSVSAWIYLLVMPNGIGIAAAVALYAVSLGVVMLLAVPLMMFDQWWMGILARAPRALVKRWRQLSPGRYAG